jgi:hypothetical protein
MLAQLSRLVQGVEQSPVLEWVRKPRICSSFYSPKNWAERSGGLKPRHKLDGFSSTLRLLISSLSTSVLVLPTALQCSSIILNSDS